MKENNVEYLKKIFEEMTECNKELSRNRLSLINGKYDFSAYVKDIKRNGRKYLDYIEGGEYSDIQKCIAMILVAEVEYQNNNCYDSLVLCNSALAFLEDDGIEEIWVVARFIQMCIMIVTGQLKAIYPMVNGMSKKVEKSRNQELKDNYEALKVWCALYDDDRAVIDAWMDNKAPNEYEILLEKDIMRYFIKARVYYMQEKYLAAISLLQGLEKVISDGARDMEICELYLLKAMSFYGIGDKRKSLEAFGVCLGIAESRGFLRLLADEGEVLYLIARQYAEEKKCDSVFFKTVMSVSKETALTYPNYLKSRGEKYVKLTDREKEVLKLMIAGRSNAEIASFLACSVNTVKYHLKNIFTKLKVSSRAEAIKIAQKEKIL